MAATEPIRSKHQIKELAGYFLKRGQIRNYLLIVMGVGTALRISDLLRLRWEDVYDFDKGCVYSNITIIEKKTGKIKTIALNKSVTSALLRYASQAAKKNKFLLENGRTKKAISRIQAYRIIRSAAETLQFQIRASCHSLRKTFGYHAWKEGSSPVVIMEIYNHSSFAITRRYLGINQDDQNEVYLKQRLFT